MYSDEDLNSAIDVGIFDTHAVDEFRQHVAKTNNINAVDEENFRLLSGFNDIFVLAASVILLSSLAWLGFVMAPVLGAIFVAAGSWGLAEVFVRRKRMALPAIGLLLSFLGALFAIPILAIEPVSEFQFIAAGLLATIGAFAHWRYFKVPITLAAGVAAFFLGVFGMLVNFNEVAVNFYPQYMIMAGFVTFLLAMYWDGTDPKRETRRSDVAFWLHLLSAPLIVHPIFSNLAVFSGIAEVGTSVVIFALYLLLALVSIAIDRRAIMVSALIYVIYAISGLLENVGLVSYSMAVTGTIIGGSLLLLSAYWQQSRKFVVGILPKKSRAFLPAL